MALFFVAGCPANDPNPTRLDSGGDARRDSGKNDGSATCSRWPLPDVKGDDPACTAASGDFIPGDANDGWAACISDDNSYHRFDVNISSIARVAGFEAIAKLLLRDGSAPSKQDFISARLAYSQPEGLDSRVSRREDEHFKATTKKCSDMQPPEIAANADRCVGQAQLQPLLNAAFKDGADGIDPLLNAARIEAALLWFFYVSTYKEAVTCTAKQKDCDSAWAYYTGGEKRIGGAGLSRYISTVSKQAHDRVWDGVLALRCWRDLDQSVPATNTAMRDRALAQLDRALLRGLALIVKSRLAAIDGETCAPQKPALWLTARILGQVLLREADVQDKAQAAILRAELKKDSGTADVKAVVAAIDRLFPCP